MNPLTEREMEVAELIHQGKIEKEIASELYISSETVHTHTKNIRRKLNARNGADITRIYLLELRPYTIVILFILLIYVFFMYNPRLLETLQTSLNNIFTK